MTCFLFHWENRSNEKYHSLPHLLTHWHLYPHTWSYLLVLWMKYHCPDASSPLCTRSYPACLLEDIAPIILLSSVSSPFLSLLDLLISFQRCCNICSLENTTLPWSLPSTNLFLCSFYGKLLKRVVCTFCLYFLSFHRLFNLVKFLPFTSRS